MQRSFLARKELIEICAYSVGSIKKAIGNHKKLADILLELQQVEGSQASKELPKPVSDRPDFPDQTIRSTSKPGSTPSGYRSGSYSPTVEKCGQCGGNIDVAMAGRHSCHF